MKNDVGIKNPVNPDKVGASADSRAEYGNEMWRSAGTFL